LRAAAPPAVPEILLYAADPGTGLFEPTGGYRSEQPPPFWAFAWAGGQALARHLLDHPDLVRDREVLDVGAGSGLVAIAAAKAGASRVRAAEIDPDAIAAIDRNAALNGVTVEAVLGDALDGDAAGADVVTGGDVFYTAATAARMMRFLRRVGQAGARVLVGDAGRGFLPEGRFTALAGYRVPVPVALEDTGMKDATVFELATPPGGGRSPRVR